MKNRLSNFLLFIEKTVLHAAMPGSHLISIGALNDSIQLEKEKLLESLNDLYFGPVDNLILARLLRIYHVRIACLSNTLYAKIREKIWADSTEKAPYVDLIFQLVLTLEELLTAARTTTPVPDDQLPSTDYNTDINGQALLHIFSASSRRLKRHKLPAEIVEILQTFFQEIDSKRSLTFTYQQLEYAAKVSRGIQRMLQREDPLQWPDKIWQLLIYLNFNKERMMQYSKQRIYEQAIMDKSFLLGHAMLTVLLKELRQLEVNPNVCYEYGHISLKVYTENLILEELNWMDQQQVTQETDLLKKQGIYFTLDITVKQMILWAEINVELGRIPNHSQAQVVKALTTVIKTTNAGSISYQSARKKINDTDSTTVKGLIKHLDDQRKLLEYKYSQLL